MRTFLLLSVTAAIAARAQTEQSCQADAQVCEKQCEDDYCYGDCKIYREDCECTGRCKEDEECKMTCPLSSGRLPPVAPPPLCPAGIANALYLVIDGSGSVSQAEWELQIDGYISGLNSVIPLHFNQIAIGVSVFSSGNTELFSMDTMDMVKLAALETQLLYARSNRATVLAPGGTNIASGLQYASTHFGGYAGCKKTIDLSTDGSHGAAAATASGLHSSGFALNCLKIPPATCAWVSGVGQTFAATSFSDVGDTLVKKLKFEIGTPAPTPEPRTPGPTSPIPTLAPDCHTHCPTEEEQCKRQCQTRECVQQCEEGRLNCHRECCCHENCPEKEEMCKKQCPPFSRFCIKNCEQERVNCHWQCCRVGKETKPGALN
jgi:hypothetical protein